MPGVVKRRNARNGRRRNLAKYGITPEDFETMLAAQGGHCAICGTTDWKGRENRPHVDHCHECGAVRGLLCRACNHGLGNFGDDPTRIERALRYVRSHGTRGGGHEGGASVGLS